MSNINNGSALVKYEPDESELEQLVERINQLPASKRVELGQKLLGESGLTVVFGANNVINSTAIQINGTSEDFKELIQAVSPDALSELLLAIARRIDQSK